MTDTTAPKSVHDMDPEQLAAWEQQHVLGRQPAKPRRDDDVRGMSAEQLAAFERQHNIRPSTSATADARRMTPEQLAAFEREHGITR